MQLVELLHVYLCFFIASVSGFCISDLSLDSSIQCLKFRRSQRTDGLDNSSCRKHCADPPRTQYSLNYGHPFLFGDSVP
ncbi:hypothetical protein SCHPADRAFT_608516 [Schizopora paradoxa]|uniref:Uncharacterized protein n=1 Tax=Schizopora paradoxa TaxID=27342 RepID=A0A0H2R9D8_9AGAM|nr:hypothetical protein SCHPADRAFT_608516 [Schizopora paradoxa]